MTFIKLPVVIKTFVLSILSGPFAQVYCHSLSFDTFIMLCFFCVRTLFYNVELNFTVVVHLLSLFSVSFSWFMIVIFPDNTLVCVFTGKIQSTKFVLSRRKVDLCCVQNTRYRGGHCCIMKCKDSRYKLLWSGNSKATAGVGVFVEEKWIEKVFGVKLVSNRIILVKIIDGQRMLCILSVYALQCGLSNSVKDLGCDCNDSSNGIPHLKR